MTAKIRQMSRRIGIPGRTLVRNGMGIPILCAWDDCQKNGFDEIKVIVREPQKALHYIFCSTMHKRFFVNGHRDYGNLAR